NGIRDFHVTGVQTCALPIWCCCAGVLNPAPSAGQMPPAAHYPAAGTDRASCGLPHPPDRESVVRANPAAPAAGPATTPDRLRAGCHGRATESVIRPLPGNC